MDDQGDWLRLQADQESQRLADDVAMRDAEVRDRVLLEWSKQSLAKRLSASPALITARTRHGALSGQALVVSDAWLHLALVQEPWTTDLSRFSECLVRLPSVVALELDGVPADHALARSAVDGVLLRSWLWHRVRIEPGSLEGDLVRIGLDHLDLRMATGQVVIVPFAGIDHLRR